MCGSVSVRCGVCHVRGMHQCVAYGKRVYASKIPRPCRAISQLALD